MALLTNVELTIVTITASFLLFAGMSTLVRAGVLPLLPTPYERVGSLTTPYVACVVAAFAISIPRARRLHRHHRAAAPRQGAGAGGAGPRAARGRRREEPVHGQRDPRAAHAAARHPRPLGPAPGGRLRPDQRAAEGEHRRHRGLRPDPAGAHRRPAPARPLRGGQARAVGGPRRPGGGGRERRRHGALDARHQGADPRRRRGRRPAGAPHRSRQARADPGQPAGQRHQVHAARRPRRHRGPARGRRGDRGGERHGDRHPRGGAGPHLRRVPPGGRFVVARLRRRGAGPHPGADAGAPARRRGERGERGGQKGSTFTLRAAGCASRARRCSFE